MKLDITKKILITATIILLISTLLFIIISDFSGNNKADNENTECTHVWEKATCTAPYACSVCGVTKGEPIAHIGEFNCNLCGLALTKWEIGEYVDEFEIPTGKNFIMTESTSGSYNTVNTTKAALTARLQIDVDEIGFILLEKGTSFVILEDGTSLDYEIKVLDGNNQKHLFKGTLHNGSTKIIVEDTSYNDFLTLLGSNTSVMIYMKPENNLYTSYLFTLETAKITDAYRIHIQAQ